MKINKFKTISAAVYCVATAFWAEIQSMDGVQLEMQQPPNLSVQLQNQIIQPAQFLILPQQVRLPQISIEDLSSLLRGHDLYDKKIARNYLRKISETESINEYPATKALLLYGKEGDKIFSREKLFRFLINSTSTLDKQSVAETLFNDLSHANDKLIGARILSSIDGLGYSDLRFNAIWHLATTHNANINMDQLNVLINFSLQQNNNRYRASKLLYDKYENFNPNITMENLLNSFVQICEN